MKSPSFLRHLPDIAMSQERVKIVDLPSEILSYMFSSVVDIPFRYPSFPSDSIAAARDLFNLTYVNTRFRDLVVHDPHLWTIMPLINGFSPRRLEIMLARSSPHPFSLAWLEREDFPLRASVWERIIHEKSRIGFLYVEVEESFFRRLSLETSLTSESPSLMHCIIAFHGHRNHFNLHSPTISSLSVRSISPPSHDPSGMPLADGLRIWDSKFISLRSLKLVNCFFRTQLDNHSRDSKLELNLLETLILSVPYPICETLANLLVYPDECSCTITALFPPKIEVADARAAVVAIRSFVPKAQFLCSHIAVEQSQPLLHLRRENGGDVTVLFDLVHAEVILRGAIQSNLRTPRDQFYMGLWQALGSVLQERLKTVTEVHMAFPLGFQSNTPQYLPRFLSFLTRVRTVSFSPPTICKSGPFLHVVGSAFPPLRSVLNRLAMEDGCTETIGDGIGEVGRHREAYRSA
ncbi:hypothetical protein NMY22_g9861 [Coprinellus aureogranulatus]|nr:hypothetical protein NMY22_g9861 [Coprinellus aureogranulatus]